MSVWSTKAFTKDREYIVLKHTLPNMNYSINGVKFRGSYAVVEKNSKTYNTLRRFAVLKNAQEFPLTFLRKLPFITRTKDIELIYGREVYKYFVLAEAKEKEQVHLSLESPKCKATTALGNLCENDNIPESPGGFCLFHVLTDPALEELGIELQKFVPKSEKKAYRDKIIKQLGQLKKDGKF